MDVLLTNVAYDIAIGANMSLYKKINILHEKYQFKKRRN